MAQKCVNMPELAHWVPLKECSSQTAWGESWCFFWEHQISRPSVNRALSRFHKSFLSAIPCDCSLCFVGHCSLCFISRTPQESWEPQLLKRNPGSTKPFANEVYKNMCHPKWAKGQWGQTGAQKAVKAGHKRKSMFVKWICICKAVFVSCNRKRRTH